MERVPIATSLDGVDVHADKHAEHLRLHLEETPGLLENVVEVIEAIDLGGKSDAFEYDLGRVIGEKTLVDLRPGDHIMYALREGRHIRTPFVFNRKPESTSVISMVLTQERYGRELLTAWHGILSPDLPGGHAETHESWQFWATHAFVWGSHPIEPDSQTPVEHWQPDRMPEHWPW